MSFVLYFILFSFNFSSLLHHRYLGCFDFARCQVEICVSPFRPRNTIFRHAYFYFNIAQLFLHSISISQLQKNRNFFYTYFFSFCFLSFSFLLFYLFYSIFYLFIYDHVIFKFK